MRGMGALWAWMSRDDVVLTVSIIAIVLSLIGMSINLVMDR